MRISDWSSDVCSSDLLARWRGQREIGVGVLRDEIKFDLGRDDRFPALVRIEAEHFLEDRSRRDVDFGPVAVEGVGDYEGRGRSETRRSEERRVGKECVSTCRSRGSRYHYKKKEQHKTT